MSLLSLKKLATALAVVCSLAFAGTASAATDLTVGDAYYLGLINPNIPSNPSNEEDYIETLITVGAGLSLTTDRLYDRTDSSLAGPFVDPVFSVKPGEVTDFTLDGSTSYVLGKYGNYAHVWYVLGLIGDFTIPGTTGKGLSHTSFFGGTPTSVPDSGATVALIALGLAGLGLVARRRKA